MRSPSPSSWSDCRSSPAAAPNYLTDHLSSPPSRGGTATGGQTAGATPAGLRSSPTGRAAELSRQRARSFASSTATSPGLPSSPTPALPTSSWTPTPRMTARAWSTRSAAPGEVLLPDGYDPAGHPCGRQVDAHHEVTTATALPVLPSSTPFPT